METRQLCKRAATSEAALAPPGTQGCVGPGSAGRAQLLPQGTHTPSTSEGLGKKETNTRNQENQTQALSSESFRGSTGPAHCSSPPLHC